MATRSASQLAAAAAAGATATLLLSYLYLVSRRHKEINELLLHARHDLDLAIESSATSDDPNLNKCIYLDHNGTTPIHPAVLREMLPFLTTHFGNPSSGHAYGREPKAAVALARRRVMSLLLEEGDCSATAADDAIIFTGCGTEADNLAIQLALLSAAPPSTNNKKGGTRKKHVVTCNIEHPAILECLKILQCRDEIDLTIVPVNNKGIISAQDVAKAIRPKQTALCTIMAANNEVGSLQPIKDIAQACRKAGVLFHTDAAQAVGKISMSLQDLGNPDLITIVGHKMGAPKGIAALYVRPGCLAEDGRTIPEGYGSCGLALIGGGQERGRRAGTENVPYIVALGKASELLTSVATNDERQQWRHNCKNMEQLRYRLIKNLREGLGEDNIRVNGPADPNARLPSTLSIGLRNIQSGELLRTISDKVAASAGSACHASGGGVSAVLKCMNVPDEFARGTLRLSIGPGSTMKEVDEASDIIITEAKRQVHVGGH